MLETELEDLRRQRQAQSEAARAATSRLEVLRAERSAKERELTVVREQASRCDVEQAEAELKLETVVDSLRGDLDCEPAAAVETACPPLEGVSPQARVRELERDLRIMGPSTRWRSRSSRRSARGTISSRASSTMSEAPEGS